MRLAVEPLLNSSTEGTPKLHPRDVCRNGRGFGGGGKAAIGAGQHAARVAHCTSASRVQLREQLRSTSWAKAPTAHANASGAPNLKPQKTTPMKPNAQARTYRSKLSAMSFGSSTRAVVESTRPGAMT